MNTTVAQITVEELKTLIRDPDVGLELCPEFESRLRESLAYVDGGSELVPLEEMARRLEAE